jgi:uncharacterized protein YdaU (DUF1376 family)
MAQAPIMPVFTDALVSDTTHLSTEQFGAYLLILIATWRNNGKALPDDDEAMAHICRIGVRKWRLKLRAKLANLFVVNDTGWHQQRLEKEWGRVKRALEQKRSVGRAGGIARAQANGLAKSKQPITLNHIEKSLSSSEWVAARACVPAVGAAHAHDTDTWKPLGAVLGQPTASPPPPEQDTEIIHHHRQITRHLEFLQGHPDLELYVTAQMSGDPEAAQRMFELTDARMRDDREQGVGA